MRIRVRSAWKDYLFIKFIPYVYNVVVAVITVINDH